MTLAPAERRPAEGPLEAEWGALAEALEEALLRLNWRLAAEIRGAKRDAEARVYALLRATTIARLRENNPRVLEEEGLS